MPGDVGNLPEPDATKSVAALAEQALDNRAQARK
jgi:hypothetical protein